MEYQEGQYKEVATTINCVLPLLRISIRSLSKKRAVFEVFLSASCLFLTESNKKRAKS